MTSKSLLPLALLGLCISALFVLGLHASLARATPHIEAGSRFKTTTSHSKPIVVKTSDLSWHCSHDYHKEENDTWWFLKDHFSLNESFTNCIAFGFINATISTNGCESVFYPTEKVSADVYKAHMDIVCPAGKVIQLTAATCAATIGSQSGLTTVDLVNNTGASPSHLSLTPTVTGIAYTVTTDGFGCPFSGTGSKNDGEIIGEEASTLVAESKGVPVSVEITGS